MSFQDRRESNSDAGTSPTFDSSSFDASASSDSLEAARDPGGREAEDAPTFDDWSSSELNDPAGEPFGEPSADSSADDSSSFGEGVVADEAPPARSKRTRKKRATKTKAKTVSKAKAKTVSKTKAKTKSKAKASSEDEPDDGGEAPVAKAAKKAKSPRRRRSTKAEQDPTDLPEAQLPVEVEASESDADSEDSGGRRRSSRARSASAKRRTKRIRKALAEAPLPPDDDFDDEREPQVERSSAAPTRGGSTRRRRSRSDDRSESEAPEQEEERGARDSDSEEGGGRSRRRRRSRSTRGSKSEASSTTAEADEQREAEDDERPKKKSRRRGSRGGRRRKRGEGETGESADGALTLDAIPGEDDDFSLEDHDGEMRRGSTGRGASRRGASSAHSDDEQGRRSLGRARRGEEEGDKRAKTSERDVKRKVSSRRKRSKSAEYEDDSYDEEVGEKSSRSKDVGKGKAAKARSRAVPDVPRDQLILVNAVDPEENRVVVVEGERIVDLQMSVAQHKSFVNDIYRGRVVNLEPAIGAAFVDFGQGRNGFLHVSDVMEFYGDKGFSLESLLTAKADEDELEGKGPKGEDVDGEEKSKQKASRERRRPSGRSRRKMGIADILEKGQLVVGQITKDAIGDKGPTLTTYISIPGRYLVLMPSLPRTGVSRKIEDEKERRRLKRILTSLDIPEGMGVIVRTAGVGKTKSEIKRDLEYLLAVWKDFSTQLVLGRSPAPLYQESDVAIRTMRDLFNVRTEKVLVDDPQVFDKMVEFTKRLMPEHVDRIELHDGARPLFHTHGVEQDFEKIFSRRIDLPSGGSIVLDQTEALVAIDVNSGRTRDEGADFEDIALKTNLEAVPEIARQIKLRDLGGIVVLDFIDMMRLGSRKQVEKALRDCLTEDRARSKVGRLSQFGLLEMTRQRLGPGLSKLIYEACSYCRGTGRRRTAQSKAQALLRRLGSALTQKGFTKIEILAHPDTIEWLTTKDAAELQLLKDKSKRELVFKAVEDQLEDSIFHYLRADGREVRPGGRRKR